MHVQTKAKVKKKGDRMRGAIGMFLTMGKAFRNQAACVCKIALFTE